MQLPPNTPNPLAGTKSTQTAPKTPSKPLLSMEPLPATTIAAEQLDLSSGLCMAAEQRRQFLEHYCTEFDLKSAATAAKLSLNAAKQLIKEPSFQKDAQAILDARSARTHISAQRVLNRLASIAFADPRRVLNAASSGSENALTQEDAALIAGIKPGKFGLEVKLHNQIEALGLLGKHLGLFKETHEHEFVFKKMGDVIVGAVKDEEGKIIEGTTLTFDIGSDPEREASLESTSTIDVDSNKG